MTGGPWRILVLDKTPDDPMWILATVTDPADVRPARLDHDGRYRDWLDVVAWVASRGTGGQPELDPMAAAAAWTVGERKPR